MFFVIIALFVYQPWVSKVRATNQKLRRSLTLKVCTGWANIKVTKVHTI
jgi:hypothetical protein